MRNPNEDAIFEYLALKIKEKTDWQLVGNIGVDAGMIWLGDPCYLSDGKGPLQDWDAFCDKLQKMGRENGSPRRVYDFGITGVAVSSGFGDGSYNVYVKYSNEGSWGKRVAEVKVVFIGDEE